MQTNDKKVYWANSTAGTAYWTGNYEDYPVYEYVPGYENIGESNMASFQVHKEIYLKTMETLRKVRKEKKH